MTAIFAQQILKQDDIRSVRYEEPCMFKNISFIVRKDVKATVTNRPTIVHLVSNIKN